MNPNMVLANNDPIAGVLLAIRDILDAGVYLGAEAADELGKVLVAFDGLRSERIERTAVTKPVCRYLADALAIAETSVGECSDQIRAFSRALQPLLGDLRWFQNRNYLADKKGSDFLLNYASCELIGPGGYVPSDSIIVGIILLGPHLFYPLHAHPAIETYFVLSGHARWQRGNEEWITRPPGTFILHPSLIPHAMHMDGR